MADYLYPQNFQIWETRWFYHLLPRQILSVMADLFPKVPRLVPSSGLAVIVANLESQLTTRIVLVDTHNARVVKFTIQSKANLVCLSPV
jgi:hypothetical protein